MLLTSETTRQLQSRCLAACTLVLLLSACSSSSGTDAAVTDDGGDDTISTPDVQGDTNAADDAGRDGAVDANAADTSYDGVVDRNIADAGAADLFIQPDASGSTCVPDDVTGQGNCPCGERCDNGKCVLRRDSANKSCAQLESEWQTLYDQARVCSPQAGVPQCTDTVSPLSYCCGHAALNVGSPLKTQLDAISSRYQQLGCNACYLGMVCSCTAPNPRCESTGLCES